MQANQRVSAPGRGLLAASTASRARNARFTVAEDAGRGDPRFKTSGIRGMSAQDAPSMLRIPATCNPPGVMIGTEIRLGDALTRRR
jgi:hypothetical protein